MDAFPSPSNQNVLRRLYDDDGNPYSSVHDRDTVTMEEEEAPDRLVDIDLEADQMPTTNLHVLTSVDDDEASLSSLALIRTVVRSLQIIPPSVRDNWNRRGSNSRPDRRVKVPSSPSSLFSSDGHAVSSDSQKLKEKETSSPGNKNLFPSTRQPGEIAMEGVDLTFDQDDDPVSVLPPRKSPSLPDTESTSSSDNISSDSKGEHNAFVLPHELQELHFRWWGHGLWWTVVGIVSAFVGSVLAVLSRGSTTFAVLDKPMVVAPIYQEVNALGMLQFVVCYNESMTTETGCNTFDLAADNVQDHMFELSRCLLTLSAFLGVFFTIFLATTCYWESINLKPVGLGFLLVYFMQAFSMLFFDTDVCHAYDCKMGIGCVQCIIASGFWIVTCLSVAKMDTHKARLRRRRKRRAKRATAKAERLVAKNKGPSSEVATETSNDSPPEGSLDAL